MKVGSLIGPKAITEPVISARLLAAIFVDRGACLKMVNFILQSIKIRNHGATGNIN
jgi:hypothetical protein